MHRPALAAGQENFARSLILAVFFAGIDEGFQSIFPGFIHRAPHTEDIASVTGRRLQEFPGLIFYFLRIAGDNQRNREASADA